MSELRAQLLQWGLEPCQGHGCRVLINPATVPEGFCLRCAANRRKREREARDRERHCNRSPRPASHLRVQWKLGKPAK